MKKNNIKEINIFYVILLSDKLLWFKHAFNLSQLKGEYVHDSINLKMQMQNEINSALKTI